MGKWLGIFSILLGLLLICFGLVVAKIYFTDDDFSNGIIGDLFCEDAETLIRKSHSTSSSDGTDGTSYTFYCENNQTGEQREVSDQVEPVSLGFALGLVCGILLMANTTMKLVSNAIKNRMPQV